MHIQYSDCVTLHYTEYILLCTFDVRKQSRNNGMLQNNCFRVTVKCCFFFHQQNGKHWSYDLTVVMMQLTPKTDTYFF